MTRSTSFSLLIIASFALAVTLFATQAQAQSSVKPQCVPLHTLYKEWVAPCTKNGTAVPKSDADPAWQPCICLTGFFPLAFANEQCAKDGTDQVAQITEASLNNLCKGYKGYVAADKQPVGPNLPDALTSATSISMAAAPTSTGIPDTSKGTSAAGITSPSLVMAVASFAAVVLATAVAL
ncbi:hypothetical protein BGZ76_008066 [Entomortierella beljakovae]|nr:hypothetical protein BGZ76_008066 [Entomortierella beljakovae]